jgi:hypothetical protein
MPWCERLQLFHKFDATLLQNGGRKMAKFCKQWKKTGRKIFLQLFCCGTKQLLVIS